jgi:hypothetical protein
MARAYNVIDSDGHILEPLTLWNDYMDPAFRHRAPKLVIDKDGKERLLVEDQILGSQQGMGGIGGVGARQGVVSAEMMSYEEGRPGGFDPHKRIPDMDLDGIDAAFLYPSMGLFAGAVHDPELASALCRAYNRWLADYCKALSRPSVRHCDAADAVDRSRDRRNALRAPRSRFPWRLYPAQPLQQPDAARPGL